VTSSYHQAIGGTSELKTTLGGSSNSTAAQRGTNSGKYSTYDN